VYEEWGPLGPLAGEWEGDQGLDRAYSNTRGEVVDTPFTEKLSLKPFGPVENGRQVLYGLDYKTAAWRAGEENPFHTEVGYWLWDGAAHEVLKGFVVPRGITVLAGAIVEPGDRTFTLRAAAGHHCYSIGENHYLSEQASTVTFAVTVTLHDDDTWSYHETTFLRLAATPRELDHTDSNRLRRVAEA